MEIGVGIIVGISDIWQGIIGTEAQKAELGKVEDWNMGIGAMEKEE